MKRILFTATLFLTVSSSFAVEYQDDKLESWRNGFITAYKAMEVDTKQQGLESKKINTERYIIYFDAKGDDFAIWDKLMVQMFGYSSSVHKPIRTTNEWIIFASYDNKATALQELDILNQKIFKGSTKYKLKLFDNEKGEVFYNDKALLTSQLSELEALMRVAEEQKLKLKQKELEENQKVAVVYVDKVTKEVIGKSKLGEYNIPTLKKDTQNTARSEPEVSKKETEKAKSLNLAAFIEHNQYVEYKRLNRSLFSHPSPEDKYKLRTPKKGEVFKIEAKNGYGWLKVKGEEMYIPDHFVKVSSDIKFKDFIDKSKNKQEVVIKEQKTKDKKEVSTEKIIGSLSLTGESIVFYSLDKFSNKINQYSVDEFMFLKFVDNGYEKYDYSAIVKDSDGKEYAKIYKENIFIPLDSVYIIN